MQQIAAIGLILFAIIFCNLTNKLGGKKLDEPGTKVAVVENPDPAPSGNIDSGSSQDNNIRHIDFRNFSYQPGCLNPEENSKGETIRVTNGTYSRGSVDDPTGDRVYFEIKDVVYGDVNGDGREEALVITNCNTGGTGQFSDGILYAMRSGKPLPILTLGMGDRADGGISGARIEGGLIKVDRFGTINGGACCPEYIETTTYRLEGNRLAQVGRPTRRSYKPEEQEPDNAARRIQFQRGRTTAILNGTATSGTTQKYLLGARAGQTMTVHLAGAAGTSFVIYPANGSGPLEGAERVRDWSGNLPQSGDYVIEIGTDKSAASYTLEVGIR